MPARVGSGLGIPAPVNASPTIWLCRSLIRPSSAPCARTAAQARHRSWLTIPPSLALDQIVSPVGSKNSSDRPSWFIGVRGSSTCGKRCIDRSAPARTARTRSNRSDLPPDTRNAIPRAAAHLIGIAMPAPAVAASSSRSTSRPVRPLDRHQPHLQPHQLPAQRSQPLLIMRERRGRMKQLLARRIRDQHVVLLRRPVNAGVTSIHL